MSLSEQQFNFHDIIDKIVYINLDKRTDRKKEIEDHFHKYEIPKDKIIRLSATENSKGNIGCSFSHVRALEMAIENKWESVLIVEDDLEFNYTKKELDKIFLEFANMFKNKYDLFQMAWGPSKEVKQIKKTFFYKCICGGSALAYLVNSKFYPKLIQNFKEGNKQLIETNGETIGKNGYSPYNLDMYWCKLQKETMFWITHLPTICKTRPSYSDIRNKHCDWNYYNNK
jgi:glycosyl transferase, family 25